MCVCVCVSVCVCVVILLKKSKLKVFFFNFCFSKMTRNRGPHLVGVRWLCVCNTLSLLSCLSVSVWQQKYQISAVHLNVKCCGCEPTPLLDTLSFWICAHHNTQTHTRTHTYPPDPAWYEGLPAVSLWWNSSTLKPESLPRFPLDQLVFPFTRHPSSPVKP